MTSATAQDAYTILGVARDADDEAIATAYRALARQFHPDIAGDPATRRMMDINAAFESIRTQQARAAYAVAEAAAPTPVEPRPKAHAWQGDERAHRAWTPERDGTGAAGPPPGRPSGSVLDFGRHIGWSLGEIARVDPGYLVWLAEKREGRPYLAEIDALLARTGHRPAEATGDDRRSPGRGVFGSR